LAMASVMNVSAFAANYEVDAQAEDTKAIVMCYDENGKLVHSKLFKAENGEFNIELSSECDQMRKKIYFVDTKRFGELKEIAETPASTDTPAETVAPTQKPAQTTEPTVAPTKAPSQAKWPSIYEKQIDSIYAPAVVKEVEVQSDKDGNDIYAVTVFYQGEEIKVGIEEELGISTAPSAYADVIGESMNVLEAGDVIVMESNIAGDSIKNVDFIFRPTAEDIATGETDYGTNFEDLFVSDGKVAGKWTAMKYGNDASKDRYQYAFGIIGKRDANTITLINKSGSEDEAIEISTVDDTIVYACDVSGKELTLEIGDVSDIQATIPRGMFNDTGVVELNDDYSYNYALVRVVDGIATDVVVYNNYNE